jgi:hypothetical protein
MQITITIKLDKLSFKIGKTNNIEINKGNNFNEIFFIFDAVEKYFLSIREPKNQ